MKQLTTNITKLLVLIPFTISSQSLVFIRKFECIRPRTTTPYRVTISFSKDATDAFCYNLTARIQKSIHLSSFSQDPTTKEIVAMTSMESNQIQARLNIATHLVKTEKKYQLISDKSYENDNEVNPPLAYLVKFVNGMNVPTCSASIAVRNNYHEKSLHSAIISFDQNVNEEFIDDFLKIMNCSNIVRVIKRTGTYGHPELLLKLNGTINQKMFQSLLDKANKYFDPIEVEKRRQERVVLEKRKAKEELVRKAAEEKRQKEAAEQERLKQEAEEQQKLLAAIKLAEERKIQEEANALRLKKEAEKQQKIEEDADYTESSFRDYSITQLPENFWGNYLNQKGQIGGSISGLKAAVWDPQRDIVEFPLPEQSSMTALNDKNFAAISYYSANNTSQAVLWNINNNTLKCGPVGNPYAINNKNNILVNTGGRRVLWNTSKDTLTFISGQYPQGIDDNDKLYYEQIDSSKGLYSINYNHTGSTLFSFGSCSTNLSLCCNGVYHLVSFCSPVAQSNNPIALLNDKNEVIAITIVTCGKKRYPAIVQWDVKNKGRRSKRLKDFVDNTSLQLVGFNNAGQILIRTIGGQGRTQSAQFFLLTPR